MKTNQEYKNAALAALKGNWAPAVVASIVYIAIALLVSGSSSVGSSLKFSPGVIAAFEGVGIILSIFVASPLSVGYTNAQKLLYLNADNKVTSNMFNIVLSNYVHIFLTYLLMTVKIILWSLLLIVPGIIKSFSYAMTPYIMVDHPELSCTEAIKESEKLMNGHKFDLFYLYISFIGWFILAIVTCGIGLFWLMPYVETAQAAFYQDLKGPEAPVILE